MRVDGNQGGTLGYEPNSYGEWQQQPDLTEPPLSLKGAADHWNHREDDDYSQPRLLFRLMTAEQKEALFENTARAMGDAPQEVKVRHIGTARRPTRPTATAWRRRWASRWARSRRADNPSSVHRQRA
jgi:catalase